LCAVKNGAFTFRQIQSRKVHENLVSAQLARADSFTFFCAERAQRTFAVLIFVFLTRASARFRCRCTPRARHIGAPDPLSFTSLRAIASDAPHAQRKPAAPRRGDACACAVWRAPSRCAADARALRVACAHAARSVFHAAALTPRGLPPEPDDWRALSVQCIDSSAYFFSHAANAPMFWCRDVRTGAALTARDQRANGTAWRAKMCSAAL